MNATSAPPRGWPLWTRLSLLFVALLLACFSAAAWLQMGQSIRESQRIEQRLLHRLADHIAAESRAIGMRGLDASKLGAVVTRLRVTHPGIEVYLLDTQGHIGIRHPATLPLQRKVVDLAPLRAFLAGAAPPILGDDPLQAGARKVFSVAPYDSGMPAPGYLYAVLQGSAFDMLARPAAFDTALQIALWSVGLVAPLGALAGVAAFRLVTRPLSALTADVERLERETRQDAGVATGNEAAAAPRDEITLLRGAFERLAATNRGQWLRLSQQDRQRRELVANISHDLRTPLASIHGYLETLLLKSGQISAAERDRYLRTALSQSQRVARLAEALLELAKFELGTVRLHIEAFSMVDLTLDVLQKLALAAQARGQQLLPVLPPSLPAVAADIGMIERVLTNLLDNAIHHAPEGGSVQVALVLRGGHVHVVVADNGPGLPPAVRARLFDAPAGSGAAAAVGDADDRATLPSTGGNGLGLLIVRQVLRLHGTDIHLDDGAGQGCSFSFDLPVAAR